MTLFATLKSVDFAFSLLDNSIQNRDLFVSIGLNDILADIDILRTLDRVVKYEAERLKRYINLKVYYSNRLNPSVHDRTESTATLNDALQDHLYFMRYIEFGVELDDCADVIEARITTNPDSGRGKALLESVQFKLLQTASYVICSPKFRTSLGDKWQMVQELEGDFYIKSMLSIFFPNLKQVHFKMGLHPRNPLQSTETLLLDLYHMATFANEYNVSYLPLPAFARENANHASWWKISNYANLSDTSAFQDIQSKFLKTEPRPPVISRIEKESKDSSFTRLLVPVLVGTVGILICVLIFVLVKERRNRKLLSNAEVREFIYGRKRGVERDGEMIGVNMSHIGQEYNKKFEIPLRKIFIEPNNVLGSGNFGVVYKASINTTKGTFIPAAVKMPKRECDKPTFIGMLGEVKLLIFLGNHPNLVGFLGCHTNEIRNGLVYIVMEHCSGGSLLNHLRSIQSGNSRNILIHLDLSRFCSEIASGMEYISSKNVIHGDLAARNVLLNELKVCKISDFGLSKKLYHYQPYIRKGQEQLPWRWMSYESLSKLEFSTKSDIWSFGITAWEIFSLGDVPYPGMSCSNEFPNTLLEGLRPVQPTLASTDIYEKMMTCWDIEPESRPNFEDLCTFFKSFQDYSEVTNEINTSNGSNV